jgi:hypothetical protein
MEMVLWSIVTAPVLAKALPQPIVAPVVSVMLVLARIFPSNEVPVPRVAETGTFQNTPASGLVLITSTFELDAVISVDVIWKTQN